VFNGIAIFWYEFLAQVNLLKGKITKSNYCLERAANKGSSTAQCRLALRYYEGEGFPIDHSKAVKLFLLAAEQNDMYGEANLGSAYYEGRGVSQSFENSKYWYKRAANSGHPESMYNLGLMYADGLGTIEDHTKAIEWLGKAANAGVIEAKDALTKVKKYGKT
jgi:TPR repeat protein